MTTPARHRRRALLGAALLAAGLPRAARAQGGDWPARPVQVVVSYATGGLVDVVVRLLAEPVGQALGQPVVVLNRPGGNTNIGPASVLQAPADGYTLLASSTATVFNPVLDRKLGWGRDSFQPVARLAQATNLIVVPASSGIRTLAEFVARARARPGMTTPFTGYGSSQAVSRENFTRLAGIRLLDVPYKGGVGFIPDLLSGQLAVSFSPLNVVLRLVQDGQLVALANTGERRSTLLPEVPTLAEAGFGEATSVSWIGIHAPAGVPAGVPARLVPALHKALQDARLQSRLIALGTEPAFLEGAAFLRFLDQETARAERYVASLPATR